MKKFEKVWKTLGIFFAVVVGGVVLLTLAFMVPVNENNRAASNAILEKEGWYPVIPIVSASQDEYFHSYYPGVLDDGSENVILHNAFDSEEENVLLAAMDMHGYSRYWHGYVAVLRPLLAIFDYGEIRSANSMMQLLLIVLLCLFIYQKKGIKYSLLALTSYCLLMPMVMPFCLHYSSVFYITHFFLLYLASRKEEMPDGIKLYWIFMAAGMLTSYFDLLTNPLYTWGVPMVWWLLLQTKSQKQGDYVKKVLYTGIWWLSGYAGMWFMKLCLGSALLKRNIFEDAFTVGAGWMDSENGLAIPDRLEAVYANWKHYEYKLYVIILLGWFLFVFISGIRNGIIKNVKNKALLLTGLSSAVWYLVVAKQTEAHHFFTHRTWGICILAILGILLISTETYLAQERQERLKTLLMLGICGGLAAILSFLPKEDVSVINGEWEYKEIQVREGEVCKMSFSPSFPVINRFTLCARTDSVNGICKVIIEDEKTKIYEEEIPLKEYQDTTAATIPVSWELEKEKEYSMHLSFENADSDTYLLVTLDGNMPLAEYGEVWLEEEKQDGQILSGLIYRYRALSKFTLCALWIGWMGVLLAICLAFFVRAKADDTE